MSWLQFHKDGWLVALKVCPGAKQTQLAGVLGQRLKLRVQAPASEGRANEAIIRWFTQALNLRFDQIEIVQGHTRGIKTVLIRNCERHKIEDLLESSSSRGADV